MMKKIVPYMLIALIVVQLLAPFTLGIGKDNKIAVQTNKAEAFDCVINKQDISTELPNDTGVPRVTFITLKIKTTGTECIGKTLSFRITSTKDGGINNQELETIEYLITVPEFSFKFKTGEKTCSGGDCNGTWIKLIIKGNASENSQILNIGPIKYMCLGRNAEGEIECGVGPDDYSWSVLSPGLSPVDATILLKGKYYYTTTQIPLGPGNVTTTKSDSYDSIELCNEAKAKTDKIVIPNWTVKTTPCELFDENNSTITKTTIYYFEMIKDGNVMEEQTFEGDKAESNCNTERVTFNKVATESNSGITTSECKPKVITQVTTGTTNKNSLNAEEKMPGCNIFRPSTYAGCIGQILYKLVFRPSSALFAITGKLLDVSIGYSVKDTSYRSMFVVEGWRLIKDLCNMFFIFVLLYIAFGTILNLNSVKTKEMIINVVIIGLLINFSLFATQFIIDASNILTRVFYNESALVVGEKGLNNKVVSKTGNFGEIRLSEAIVTKIGPQKLITDAGKVGMSTNDGDETYKTDNGPVTAGTFILVVILASMVNIVGIIVFLSVSLIFIARVIGLWLAMIFAPIAFFSYIVPQMQGWEMVGWKKWWPDTIKMAFLAPVFLFFMYLIIKFLDIMGIAVFDANNKEGMDFVVAIMVPFALVMVLMWKAKSIATDMSGKMGQSITNGMKAVGGIALGGAALGTALLGRKTIGSVSKYVQNDAARKKDATTFGDYKNWSVGKKINPFAYVGQAGKTAMAGIATGIHKLPSTKKDAAGNRMKLGEAMQEEERGFGKKASSQNTLDSKTEQEFADKGKYKKGVKFGDLREDEQLEVRISIDKDQLAKEMGFGANFEAIKEDFNKQLVTNRINGAYTTYKTADKSDSTKLAAAETQLKTDTGITNKDTSGQMIGFSKANTAVGEFVSALRKGSYDVRNISQLKSASKGIPMFGVGLAAIIASGVRVGLKSGVGVEPGTGQKDFLKDIGNTITESLKGMKINVSSSGGDHGSGKK